MHVQCTRNGRVLHALQGSYKLTNLPASGRVQHASSTSELRVLHAQEAHNAREHDVALILSCTVLQLSSTTQIRLGPPLYGSRRVVRLLENPLTDPKTLNDPKTRQNNTECWTWLDHGYRSLQDPVRLAKQTHTRTNTSTIQALLRTTPNTL